MIESDNRFSTPDREFLRRRRLEICEGLKEGIREEVERLRRLGIPLCVGREGKVIEVHLDGSGDAEAE